MCSALAYVRFTPESDIKCDKMECPLWARSEHSAAADFPRIKRIAQAITDQIE